MFPIEPDDGIPSWAVGTGEAGERPHVGLGRCKEADFPILRALFKDRDGLPATFDEWEQYARRLEMILSREGYRIVRIPVTPEELSAWCAARDVAISVRTCVDFVEAKVAEKDAA